MCTGGRSARRSSMRSRLSARRLSVPRKQRHTARRVWQRLCEEVDAEVAESTVRALVGRIRAELGLDAAACGVTIPQDHRPGEEAECDFGEFYAWIAGAQLRLYLFVMRLSFSGRGFVVAFANQAQEAFLEGHVLAFEHFGGVPAGQIRYDNLKDAVRRILVGRDRVETEVGRFRRNWLVPGPVVGSLAELNGLLVGWMAADDARHVGRRAQTVAEAFALEQGVLHPLPDEPFDSARLLGAKADAKARVCVLGSWYSVPARLARRRVQVRLGASQLEVLDGGTVVAVHPRSLHKGTQDLVLDHYLEILVRKPGAFAGSATLAQARAGGVFTAGHQRFWDSARRARGDGAGTRALIEVLLAHRQLPAEAVLAGIDAALKVGSTDPALVCIEARRIIDTPACPVIPITQALQRYDRPAPTLGGYDTLLDATPTGAQP